MDLTEIQNFIKDEAKNSFMIILKDFSSEKSDFLLQDYPFSILYNSKYSIETSEEFLEEWKENTNSKSKLSTSITEFLELCTKEYSIFIGEEEEEELVFYSNVENDNYDIKFMDRIRFGEDDFNPDLFINIFEFLPGYSLVHFRRVSKLWKKLIEKDSLWERRITSEMTQSFEKNLPLYKVFLQSSNVHIVEWEKNFLERYFYSKPITTGIKKMSILMKKIGSFGSTILGVINDNNISNKYVGDSSDGYGYFHDGKTWRGSVFKDYGDKYKVGDIITIILNCFTKEISFEVNGKNQGVAFIYESSFPAYFTITSGISGDEYEIINPQKVKIQK